MLGLPSRPRPHRARGARTSTARLTGGLLPGLLPGLLLGLLLGLLTGCGQEPVTIPTLRLTPGDQARCQRLVDGLPQSVAGQSKRKTQPAEALGGAWGSPAIVAQCGVGVPKDFTAGAQCTVADGVGWFVPDSQINDQSADVVMSTAGYRPVLQVTVPAKYRPNGLAAAMVQLAPMVKQDTRLVHRCG